MNSPDAGFARIVSPENRPVPPVKVELAQLPQNRPQNRFMSVFSILFLCCLLGVVCSFIYISRAQEIYESNAKIRIELRDGPTLPGVDIQQFAEGRHEKFIGQYNIVYKCLANLMDLPSFADIPEDEVVEFVMENLEITNDKEEPVIYELVYRCSKPDDAQTLLNNLIATYKDELFENCRTMVSNRLNSLHRLRGVIEEELEVARNAESRSPAYIQEIEKRLAKVNGDLFDIKAAGFRFTSRKNPIRFETLMNATYGELVWPKIGTVLMYGLIIGLIVGIIVCVLAAVFLKPQSSPAIYR